jgi:hypothetical protein
MNSIPLIDYSMHPAFAGLGVKQNQGTELLAEMKTIDEMLLRAPNGDQFQREAKSSWDRMATILRDSVSVETIRDQTELALYNAFDTMTAYCRWTTKPKKKL